jgi:cell division protein FtsN
MITLAVVVLLVFVGGLYFITHYQPDTTTEPQGQAAKPGNGLGLPPKPEERWSYIKELENRQVTNSPNSIGQPSGNSQVPLSAEQRKILEQIQSDMQQPATQLPGVDANGRSATARDGGTKPALNSAANNTAANTQQIPTQSQAPALVVQPKKPTPPPAPIPAPTTQTAAQAQNQRWIIQCGSFRETEQAESVKVNLAFSGISSRISSGNGWHRVVLGPYSNRDGADKALQQIKSSGVSNCVLAALDR